MSEGGEPSAPATPGLIPLSYTTPRDAAADSGHLRQYTVSAIHIAPANSKPAETQSLESAKPEPINLSQEASESLRTIQR